MHARDRATRTCAARSIGIAMGLTAIALIYSPWGKRSGRAHEPGGDADLPAARQGRARGCALLHRSRSSSAARSACCSCIALLGAAFTAPPVRYVATLPGAAGVASRSRPSSASPSLMMTTVLRRVQPRRAGAVHRPLRRRAGRAVHRVRGAAVRHEHESGAQLRVRAPARHLARTSGSTSSAPLARHARRGASCTCGVRRAPRRLREAACTPTTSAAFTAATSRARPDAVEHAQ